MVLYVCTALLGLFYLKLTMSPTTAMPRSLQCLLFAIPTFTVLVSQAQMLLGIITTGEATALECLYNLISLTGVIGSYCLTCMTTRAYDQLLDERTVTQQLELQLDHVQRSSAIVEQVRKDKHELKNNYLYMQALLDGNRIDELREFLDVTMPRHFDDLTEFHTGNSTLDYLLEEKASEVRDAGARAMFKVVVPADLEIDDRDLCGLLGNLLDNAIDASRTETEAGNDAEVQLVMQMQNGMLLVQVKNRCAHDVMERNPHLRTTKKNASEHGVGLKVVRSIVTKYNGTFDAHMDGDDFVATAMLAL